MRSNLEAIGNRVEDGYNASYPDQMATMVEHLRSDFPLGDAPFLMSGVVPAWAELRTPNPNEVCPWWLTLSVLVTCRRRVCSP